MSSRFKELFEEAKQGDIPTKKNVEKTVQKKLDDAAPKSKSAKTTGKRSNPKYTGAFAYIPIELHDDVKIKLLRKKDLDFSELIEYLLTQWISEQK